MKWLNEMWQYREMINGLVRRDLKGRYKGAALGFLWTLFNPLLQLVVYTIVFSIIMPNNIERFYLFLFVALVPWLFFSSCLCGGSMVIFTQQDMVKKIYFPRQVLPISFVIAQFINMLLSFIVIFFVVLISGIGFNFKAILYLPIVLIVHFILCLGVTFITSALTVYFRDLEYILSIISMAWMYMTPIIYSVEQVPERYRGLYYCNPMTSIIVAYRDILYYKSIPELETLAVAGGLGGIILIVGIIVFECLQKRFVEEL